MFEFHLNLFELIFSIRLFFESILNEFISAYKKFAVFYCGSTTMTEGPDFSAEDEVSLN